MKVPSFAWKYFHIIIIIIIIIMRRRTSSITNLAECIRNFAAA